ncbi:hypothetical protein [Bordetella genomosp. 9]|uniref:hypothetical protein n=1 Tax=Bordetella genomosp. 9 TaxID=1416803 RepID=UPI001C52D72C|nr:hypothetical protein [Bordetella genomosp. 9]
MRLYQRSAARAALAAACLLAAAVVHADPSYEGYREGTYLRFLNAPEAGQARAAPPTLGLSFGGESVQAVMDTGSTGIVVAASTIPDVDRLQALGPGTLSYSSSGRIMRGRWVMATATIRGANGASVTTRPLPVLAIDRIDCFRDARDCQPEDHPRHVAMIGIGYAREADHQSQSTPDKNPFLNLPGMGDGANPGREQPHRARRGYVVTREGVHVGLTPANTRGDYRYIKLAKRPDGRDWMPLGACIALDQGAPACGTALIDTGVSAMYLTVPPDRQAGHLAPGGHALSPGTRVTVRFGTDATSRSPGYGFNVGDAREPAAPSRVILVEGANRPAFVNTSVHALNVFDYLFDADGGYVGFRRVER